MTHPEELLAGYVDGALPPKDRAAVDAHLAGCARCRREVSLAVSARSGLRALPEILAPEGIATLALEEARSGRAPARDGQPPRWYRIAGVAAAAAAALLVLTLALPHIGQGGSSGDTDQKAAAGVGADQSGPRALSGATAIEIQHRNYDNDSLTALSGSYARDAAAAGAAATPSTPGTEFASAQAAQKQTADALACVQTSTPDATGTLIRLIRARFEGTPAYLALFLDGPGAGQPADRVNVWVFAANDCSILSFSYAKL
jgi:hypothetical protein